MDGKSCSISRSGQKPSRIDIAGDLGERQAASSEDPSLFHGEEASPPAMRRRVLSNEQWKNILGAVWFGLPVDESGAERFHPAFRSLFSFVARRQEGGGFQNPMQHSTIAAVVGSAGDGLLSAGIGLVDSGSLSGIARSREGHEGASQSSPNRRARAVYRQCRRAAHQTGGSGGSGKSPCAGDSIPSMSSRNTRSWNSRPAGLPARSTA